MEQRTIRELLALPYDDERRVPYNANAEGKRISEVIIDGVTITGYRAFSFVRKLTYIKSPTRSGNGSIVNLNSYATFTTPELQIDFSLLSIDTYREIMRLIYEKREHLVQCYDVVRDKKVTEKMYFEPEELPKLWTITREIQGGNQNNNIIEVFGVQDYVVRMVGTNAPKNVINIVYYDKNGISLGATTSVENAEVIIGEGIDVPFVDNYVFNNEWSRISKPDFPKYVNNSAYQVSLESDTEEGSYTISFQAQYKSDKQFTLSLAYGLGTPVKDVNGKDITAITFTQNSTNNITIGEILSNADISLLNGSKLSVLPHSPAPKVEIDGISHNTHIGQGWRFTQDYNSSLVDVETPIKVDGDIIIYQVFTPVVHTVTYKNSISGSEYENLKLTGVEYGVSVPMPKLTSSLHTFVGWFTDEELTKQFSGKMPPYDLTLYAKWEDIVE